MSGSDRIHARALSSTARRGQVPRGGIAARRLKRGPVVLRWLRPGMGAPVFNAPGCTCHRTLVRPYASDMTIGPSRMPSRPKYFKPAEHGKEDDQFVELGALADEDRAEQAIDAADDELPDNGENDGPGVVAIDGEANGRGHPYEPCADDRAACRRASSPGPM